MKQGNLWEGCSGKELEKIEETAARYKDFLNKGKTERECIRYAIALAEQKGFRSLKKCVRSGAGLSAGDKVYAVYNEKLLVLYYLGKEDMEKGMNILGAHIDSPRIDVKQNPLYEKNGFAYLDTHYYGGIKKYQWVAMPLALHGVVIKKDGTKVDVCIGEQEEEPIFCITDLLIHLAQEQMEKKASKVIDGEDMDLLIGSMPVHISTEKDSDKKEQADEKVKANQNLCIYLFRSIPFAGGNTRKNSLLPACG